MTRKYTEIGPKTDLKLAEIVKFRKYSEHCIRTRIGIIEELISKEFSKMKKDAIKAEVEL